MTKSLVVITGASSGIGAALAKHFSAAGHPLLLLARRLDRLEELNLTNTLCEQVDITDGEAVRQALDKAEELFGPVECFINNAGVMLLGQVDSQPAYQWQQMFDVNVLSLLNAMQLVISRMKQRNIATKSQRGTIINISSIAGRKTFPNHSAYCGTKFAVSAMTENIREEVAEFGIRVSSICPGAVETELLSHTSSEQIKNDYQDWKESMGGALVAEDIARSALFMFQQPQSVCIRELVVAATGQQP